MPPEAEMMNEMNKRTTLLSQLTSIDSEHSDASPCNLSDAGSLTVNPVFGTRLFSNSFRSTYSDSEIEVNYHSFNFFFHYSVLIKSFFCFCFFFVCLIGFYDYIFLC